MANDGKGVRRFPPLLWLSVVLVGGPVVWFVASAEDGRVSWTYQSDTYRERARPEDISVAIAAMNQSR